LEKALAPSLGNHGGMVRSSVTIRIWRALRFVSS